MRAASSWMNCLIDYQEGIEQLLTNYLGSMGSVGRLRDACAYALLNGGKRYRPALVQMVAKALGHAGEADEAALAVEFFHTASLIADDLPCMDNDSERRGRPSLHIAYDEATALLASYALIAEGYALIGKNSLRQGPRSHERCALALENCAYNTGLAGATGGQSLDLFPTNLDLMTVQKTIQMKTVSLFEIAFVLGWLFGGGVIEELEAVKKAAYHFGMAFQIADDLIDASEDAQKGRLINVASIMGIEPAINALEQELSLFRSEILRLPLRDRNELLQLSEALYSEVS